MADFLIKACAEYAVFLVLLGALITLLELQPKRRIDLLLLLAGSGLLAFLLSLLAAKLHYEPRPFVAEHLRPIVRHSTDNGFPSDHALFTMTLTASVYWYNRRLAGFMLVGTLLTGLGRVLGHLHSPLQIIAGWLIASIAVLVVHTLQQYVRQQRSRLRIQK